MGGKRGENTRGLGRCMCVWGERDSATGGACRRCRSCKKIGGGGYFMRLQYSLNMHTLACTHRRTHTCSEPSVFLSSLPRLPPTHTLHLKIAAPLSYKRQQPFQTNALSKTLEPTITIPLLCTCTSVHACNRRNS